MKIGILTFNSAYNFGAVLQCYGLFATLAAMNYDVKVIDYRPEYLASYKPIFGIRDFLSRHILTLPSRFKRYLYWRRIYKLYEKFERKEMLLTRSCKDNQELSEILQEFDCVIVGSDQIWNSRFNGKDSAWYGTLRNPTQRWITYAASIGKANINALDLEHLEKALYLFNSISVRESSLGELLHSINQNIPLKPTVLDPTLLASPEIWKKWNKPTEKGNYIVTYQARECDDVFRIAELLSMQLDNAKIIPIDLYGNVVNHGYKTKIIDPPGFVSLISGAHCVVTTSFHGTAFSIITQTPFYTLRLNDGNDGRVSNLLDNLNLSSRLIDHNDNPRFERIDYTDALSRLAKYRESSLNYLKTALG